MTDSSGLYNDPEKVESYKRFYWSSVVWLLLGAITTFGVIMYSFSPRVYFNLLEAQARNPGELQSKLVMYSVLISGIGVLIGGIFLPLNLTAIVISLVIALVTAFAVVVCVFLRSSKDLFFSFFASQISCLALGIVDLIGTVSVNDKFIPGNPTYRMLLFHIGKPIGYLLVLAIIFVLEFQSFGHSLTHSLAHSLAHSLGDNPIGVNSSVDNLIGDNLIGDNLIVSSFPVESNVLMTYQIIVMNLLAVPILIVMINYCMKSDENQRKWRSTNLINAGKTLAKTLYTYLCLEEFDHTLLIVECSEGFFNSAILLYLWDPFPYFNAAFKTLVIFVLHQVFDLIGRCIPAMIRACVGKFEVLMFKIRSFEDAPRYRMVFMDSNCFIEPGTMSKTAASKYRINRWIIRTIVAIRIFLLVCILLRRHLENRFLKFMTSFPAVILITAYNSMVRGALTSLVYTQLTSIIEMDGPRVPDDFDTNSLTQTVRSYYHIFQLDVDPHVIVSILIALFRAYHNSGYVICNFLSIKYNTVLFKSNKYYERYGHWPTDDIDSHFLKFNWWVNQVFKLIIKDFTKPLNC